MVLYEKNNNSIDIYSFEYLIEDMISFRKEEIKKIEKNDVLYTGMSETKIPGVKNKEKLFLPVGDSLYKLYNISSGKTKEYRVDQILDLYYRGFFDKLSTLTTGELKNLKYYLFDLNKPEKYRNKDIISNIIHVPESLYYLQLLLNERFDELKDINIDYILELFKLEKIEEVNIKDIHGSHGYIRRGNLEQALKKANDDEFIIKKLTRK